MENSNVERIVSLLKNLGIPAKLMGYEYIKQALIALDEQPDMIHGITTRLYPCIAEKCETTASRVERGIRVAIVKSFDNITPDQVKEYYGNCVNFKSGRVSNGEFIGIMAERIRMGKD